MTIEEPATVHRIACMSAASEGAATLSRSSTMCEGSGAEPVSYQSPSSVFEGPKTHAVAGRDQFVGIRCQRRVTIEYKTLAMTRVANMTGMTHVSLSIRRTNLRIVACGTDSQMAVSTTLRVCLRLRPAVSARFHISR